MTKVRRRVAARKANESLAAIVGDELSITSLCVVDDFISTGSHYLDWAISGRVRNGGIPIGRITECYGGTSTGKTLIAMVLAINAQDEGYDVLYYDTEAAFSRDLFIRLGGDPDTIVYRTPDTVEELFDDLEEVLAIRREHKRIQPILVIWDSVAASSAREEMDKHLAESTSPALHARRNSQALRKFARLIPKDKVAWFIVNQTRDRIGSYVKEVATFGGKAIGFYSSVRIELRVRRKIVAGKSRGKKKRISGIEVEGIVKENKISIPYRAADFNIMFNIGIDEALSALELAVQMGVVSGTTWKAIQLDGKEVKFQSGKWAALWSKHKEEILDMIEEAASHYEED